MLNLEYLLLPGPAREFELPFKKIWVSWIKSIRKHTSKEIITADLLVREINWFLTYISVYRYNELSFFKE